MTPRNFQNGQFQNSHYAYVHDVQGDHSGTLLNDLNIV